MKRALTAVVVGAVFVGVMHLLANVWELLFSFLIAGAFVGFFADDAGWRTEGPPLPWGPVSTSIEYGVNSAIYAVLAYLILSSIGRVRRMTASK
jgi:hypothetical protein